MIRPRSLLALGGMALLAGCAEHIDAPLSPTFGVAVATLDSQIVNPGPVDLRPPTSSAARGVLAIRRYEAGKVIAPAAATSEISAHAESTSSTTSVSK